MTFDQWAHVIELVIAIIVIPLVSSLVRVIVSLRDATRDLTAATVGIKERLDDHEDRLRWFEGAPERRRAERREERAHEDRH